MTQAWELVPWRGPAPVREPEDETPSHDHSWWVETATRRVFRKTCAACALETAARARKERDAEPPHVVNG